MELPPTINNMYRSRVTRNIYRPRLIIYLSAEYRNYRKTACKKISALEITGFNKTDKLIVKIDLYFKTSRKQDVDNRIKATLDTLTKANLWNDDQQVYTLIVLKHINKDLEKPYMHVEIKKHNE